MGALHGPRHAHLTGFDLHANLAVRAADRAHLEHLCPYLPRPALAQGRLRLLDDGRIVLTLKTAWPDGTPHLVFEPLTLLEKLAALTPLAADQRRVRRSGRLARVLGHAAAR